jgi:hypothetical protein
MVTLQSTGTPIATLVVKREAGIANTQMAQTAGLNTPDVHLKAVSPVKIVLIRSARVFVQTLAGSIGVASTTNLLSIKGAFITAAVTAGVTALQNTGELLAKLDQTMPEMRG